MPIPKILLIACYAYCLNVNAQNAINARTPSINPKGDKIAFGYQGDIWTANLDGSDLKRITVHEGYESDPKWSPDGNSIVFSGERFGNIDLFKVDLAEGSIKQLTFRSSDDAVSSWSKEGKIFFTTFRDFRTIEREQEIYTIPEDGGTPSRFMDALGFDPILSPNGKFVAFVRGSCRLEREAYRGPANRDIWVFDIAKDKYYQISDDEGNDYQPKWLGDNKLIYVSSKTGIYNLVEQAISSSGEKVGNAVAITNFKDDGIVNFELAAAANRVIYERGSQIYTMDLKTKKEVKVKLSPILDERFDVNVDKTFSDGINDYAVSPNEKWLAFEVRGEIFVQENAKEKAKSVNISNHAYRDESPQWVNDSTLLYASDRGGSFNLYLAKSEDNKKTDVFKTLKLRTTALTVNKSDIHDPKVSPDGKSVLYIEDRGNLWIAQFDSTQTKLIGKRLLIGGWASVDDVAWSPDSKWIAYSYEDLTFNSDIFILSIEKGSVPINVSMHPKTEISPVWSPDGSKIAFVSSRRQQQSTDILFVWLKKADWEKSKADREEGYYFDTDAIKDSSKAVVIDEERIYDRIEKTASMENGAGNLAFSEDGETLYFTTSTPSSSGNDLFSIKFDGSEIKQITTGGVGPRSVKLSPKKKTLFYLKKGVVNQLASDGKSTSIDHKAKMTINRPQELEQMFEEGWRALNEGFYDPKFHGQDWAALKAKYKSRALSASTNQDFRIVFNQMLGQLNASHMGMYSVSMPETTQNVVTGLLGAELKPVANGVKVVQVLQNSVADKAKSKLNAGDVITSINGKIITRNDNVYEWLNGTVGEQLLMTVLDKQGGSREIVVRPQASLGEVLYEEWVESRKKLTDEYSNGKLGYIHIKSMDLVSFERFERELMASGYGKEGIVIDVRFNGGGWTTDYLMAVLNVKQHAYTIPRGAAEDIKKENQKFKSYYPYNERLPFAAVAKPTVALCNETSYSNAEIFSHAYKNLGIGTLVGKPTFGAVISTGAHNLIDGSYVRMPSRAWYTINGLNMEHGPAVPDIIVENSPDGAAKGVDEQLKKAVEVLMGQLKG